MAMIDPIQICISMTIQSKIRLIIIFFSFACAFCLWLSLGVWWYDALLYSVHNREWQTKVSVLSTTSGYKRGLSCFKETSQRVGFLDFFKIVRRLCKVTFFMNSKDASTLSNRRPNSRSFTLRGIIILKTCYLQKQHAYSSLFHISFRDSDFLHKRASTHLAESGWDLAECGWDLAESWMH